MTRLLAASCFVVAALTAPAQAQVATVHLVVPFTPGGSNDVVARELASGLQTQFQQPAVVENKPGGGGVIANAYVAKAPANGSVLLIAPASFTISPHLSRYAGYHPVTDFAPVGLVASVPFVMVVPASLPVRTVQELVDLAKRSPGKLTYGSVGVGTPQHLGAELFRMQAGIDLVHVPFRGATAALPDLTAGRVDLYIGAVNSLLPLIREGKLRALAATSPRRIASLPDVPTMAEAGLPGVEVGSTVGVVAPAGTPADVVAALNRQIAGIIARPDFRERMEAVGMEVLGGTPERYATFLRDDYARWGKVVAGAGIRPE